MFAVEKGFDVSGREGRRPPNRFRASDEQPGKVRVTDDPPGTAVANGYVRVLEPKRPACLVGRAIRVGGAHLDGRRLLQTFLKIIDDFHHRIGDPAILDKYVVFFLQVREQVDDFRKRQSLGRVVHVFLPDEMHFPIPPLYRL